jgi:hydrophobe/amphiphile efflux-1 (HAE1) family protein
MNLATWSIREPIPSVLLFILLTLAGVWGFKALNIQNFPDLDVPTITVALTQQGAAPEQLETEVARKVEDSLATLDGLRHIYTTITDGRVTLTVEFRLGTPLSDALVDVKDAVDRVRSTLPRDLDEPQISKVTVGPGGPILSYAVSHPTWDEETLSWFVDDTLGRVLRKVPGVAQINRVGGVTREIRVELDPTQLIAQGVTAAEVSRALARVQQDASGGRSEVGGTEQGVRTLATALLPEELSSLPVALNDGRSIRLDQVATVRDTVAERSQAAYLNGVPAVGFQIVRTKGFDEARIAEGVTQILEEIKTSQPELKIELISDTVSHTLAQYRGSMTMLFEGAVLAVIVVWVFLRDWRATLLGAIALPLSIIPIFAFMELADFSLNTITLLALAVVIGILVDDAIVEIENIARHLKMGKSVRQATEDAVTEIAPAVIATTLCLVVVFLPTAFMSGIPGLVFRQFGWTAVGAVLISLLVARLLTPMMAASLMRAHPSEDKEDSALMKRYLRWVRRCLTHRGRTVLAGVLFFVGSLMLIPLLPKGFIPAGDQGLTVIKLELPPGTPLDQTSALAEKTRQSLEGIPGIKNVFTTIGAGGRERHTGANAGDSRKASLMVSFVSYKERPSQQEIEALIRPRLEQIPGARFSMGGGGPGEKLDLVLAGQDGRTLKLAAQAVERELRETLPYLGAIQSSASLERPELTLRPNASRAAEQGISTAAIAETIRVATSGDFGPQLPKFNLETRQLDIRVRLPDSARENIDVLANLRVPAKGGSVPLGSVAEISIESGASQISRYDRERNVTLSADLSGFPLGEALAAAKRLESVQNLPPGVRLLEGGDAEIMAELFGGFGMAMVIGTLCVLCVLILLFKDFFQPITILSAVPLAAGGAFLALLAGNSEIGLPALIGLVMLLGITTKNSILLVEYAVVNIHDRGMPETEALVDACHKRVRPILMTSVAMIAGMLPLALGLGEDPSFRRPMAISVIGGLITSTALSLLVVPAVFTFVAQLERKLRGGRSALSRAEA